MRWRPELEGDAALLMSTVAQIKQVDPSTDAKL